MAILGFSRRDGGNVQRWEPGEVQDHLLRVFRDDDTIGDLAISTSREGRGSLYVEATGIPPERLDYVHGKIVSSLRSEYSPLKQ